MSAAVLLRTVIFSPLVPLLSCYPVLILPAPFPVLLPSHLSSPLARLCYQGWQLRQTIRDYPPTSSSQTINTDSLADTSAPSATPAPWPPMLRKLGCLLASSGRVRIALKKLLFLDNDLLCLMALMMFMRIFGYGGDLTWLCVYSARRPISLFLQREDMAETNAGGRQREQGQGPV